MRWIAAFVALAACCGALVWWLGEPARTVTPDLVSDQRGLTEGTGRDAAWPADRPVDATEPGVGAEPQTPARRGAQPGRAADAVPAARPEAQDPKAVWQAVFAAGAASRGAARRSGAPTVAPGGEPVVPEKVAFRALWYVGVDPEAEKTWMKAINDPRMPPETRSDLIEDLNDEGYTDNSNPTAEDLPLILARLELIERLAPHAIDQVNADAFEEAYKDLLEMYVRLGGKPRGR